jgi:hypothetical protein
MRWNWAPKFGTTWLLLLTAGMATAQQSDVKVKGRVLDGTGKPVARADVLDPAGRRSGLIDPEATVTGSAKDVPLRQALVELLKPLGLVPVAKNEVVVLTRRPGT